MVVSVLLYSLVADASPLKVMVLSTVTECTELTAQKFSESTGQQITVVPLPTADYLKLLKTGNYSKYDVYEIWYVLLEDYVKKNVLLDITRYFEQEELSDFFPKVLDNYSYVGNKLYAIPYDGDCHFLYYRPSIFKRYNLSPPKTWEDYFSDAKYITQMESASGIWGTALMANRNPFNVTTMFFNRLGWNGNSDEIDYSKIFRAIRSIADVLPYSHPDSLKMNYRLSRSLFLNGKIAMLEQYNDLSLRADDKLQSVIEGDWEASVIPSWSDDKNYATSLNGGFALGINKTSKNKNLAIEFIRFASSAEMQKLRSMSNCGVEPTRISVLSDPEYYSYSINTVLFAETYLHAMPWIRDVKSIMEITEILHDALLGKKTLDGAATEIEKLLRDKK